MKTKTMRWLVLALVVIMLVPCIGLAKDPHTWVGITLNGDYLYAMEEDTNMAYLQHATNRTYLPIRKVSESLGYEVGWDQEELKVTVSKPGTVIELWIDRDTALVNGREMKLDAPPFMVKMRTLVPLRFLVEAMGEEVNWDGDRQMVFIGEPHYETKMIGDDLYFDQLGVKITMDQATRDRIEFIESKNRVIFYDRYQHDNNSRRDGEVYILERDTMSVEEKTGGDIFARDGEDYIQGHFPSDMPLLFWDDEAVAIYNASMELMKKAVKSIQVVQP